ncbi:MAG TPA: monovalent cation:proton antiporter-2 (CPA2) family protein [Burkholderiales bacterium]|nr:monovalent cation:proton antiporter-2 (CPA2) family protein [Burkholderiales bacterium]
MQSTLQSVLILLATAVMVVVVFRSLRLPPMLGYIIVGVAIGPHALGWIRETEVVHQLAEIGVVFLMFSLGLEFSLPKLVTIRRVVLVLGSLQVVVTMLAVWAVANAFSIEWREGLILGGVLAMSSTAILAKILSERLELNTAHGRQIIGVLLFQDVAVVPLLIMVPALASGAETLARDLGLALLKAAAILVLLLFIGQRLMRAWFHLVARQKSSELFILNVLLITLGLAFLTDMAGLSLALGAFLAGALISETEYRYQVEVDIRPFRDVLLGLFFVTIGMLVNPRVVIENIGWVALLLPALLAFKTLLVLGLSLLIERNPGAALRSGLALAGCGEFGLVLLAHSDSLGLIEPHVMQPVLGAMLLSMLAAPLMVEHSEHVVRRWVQSEWMSRAMQVHNIAVQAMGADRHVVICGFGRSGQNLARLLRQESIPFIALDVDPQRIREAAAAGESVVFGDAARPEVLTAAGLLRARALAVTYADTVSALRILRHVQELRPGLPVVVRTLDDTDIDRLKSAGAVEVVAEILEGSLILASTTLMLLGVPLNRVMLRMRETREQRYSLFRGFFRGVTDELEELDQAEQPRLHSVTITPGAAAIGRPLAELELETLGVEVTLLRRRNARTITPSPDTLVEEGDVLVLLGTEEGVIAAEMKLMQG